MYFGNEKKVIVIKSDDSKFFEEAYFILKEKKTQPIKESAMIREANKIVNENFVCKQKRNPHSVKNNGKIFFLWFVSGSFFSGIVFTVLMFLIKF